ncbi:hypothetical protein CEXT_116471 [Caerostris extrusa]|uniref:Uncharacterized protein n=1 Tax=Caerostris extrusa TaxID=172846 RepID=A0AAV4VCP2_CAEEX|nr:hypothetical protein CEXT_116471 [Caerostris extrusa]
MTSGPTERHPVICGRQLSVVSNQGVSKIILLYNNKGTNNSSSKQCQTLLRNCYKNNIGTFKRIQHRVLKSVSPRTSKPSKKAVYIHCRRVTKELSVPSISFCAHFPLLNQMEIVFLGIFVVGGNESRRRPFYQLQDLEDSASML